MNSQSVTVHDGKGTYSPLTIKVLLIQAHVHGCASVDCVLPPMEIPETDVLRGVVVGVVLISALQILKVLAIMITRALFPKGSGDGDNCFSTAGHQLFAANLKYLRRELENPDNADLVRYWQRADPDKMHENLTRDGHEDLMSAAVAIDPDAGR